MQPLTGFISTSFPRSAGDPAGSFVASAACARLREGGALEIVAAGEAARRGGSRAQGSPSGTPPALQTGAFATTARLEDRDVTVWRVPAPLVDERPLFYGAGAPETLERGGLASWLAAGLFTLAQLATVQRLAPRWSSIEAHWLVPSGLVARLAAPHLPQRCWVHSGDVAALESLAGKGGRSLARWLARGNQELLFVSADLQERFARLAGRLVGRVSALPLCVHRFPARSADTQAAAKRALALGPRTVLGIGRLVPIKGFDVLIEACANLSPAVELILLGDGPERRALELAARRLGVAVRFLGECPHDDVPQWLTAADLYVQSSRRLASGRTEGLPMALREALAVKVPVIATRTGGMNELSPSLAGLVPAEDAVSLGRAMAAFFAADGRR